MHIRHARKAICNKEFYVLKPKMVCVNLSDNVYSMQSVYCGHTLESLLHFAELHSFVWESIDDIVQCVYIKHASFLV